MASAMIMITGTVTTGKIIRTINTIRMEYMKSHAGSAQAR
jgi:hypothetical protein